MDIRRSLTASLVSCLGVLSAATADTSAAERDVLPTQLDFVVLASLADTSNMMVMSNLRAASVSASETARILSADSLEHAVGAAAKLGE